MARYVDRSGGPRACWLWTGAKNAYGYGVMKGPRRGPRVWGAHRVAYELTHGTIPEGMLVCHRCDVRACCNPAHLFLGTPADNTRDMIEKGRSLWQAKPHLIARGEAAGCVRLTEEQVREIRESAANGQFHHEIAKRFGVSRAAVGRVVTRRSWAHVA